MIKITLLYAFWAAAAGALIPVMAAMNGRLGKTIGNIPYSVLILFTLAVVGAAVFVLVSKAPFPTSAQLSSASPIDFSGGLIVLFYVISATFLAPRFGVANTIFFVVVAQIIAATAIDHYGLFSTEVRALSLKRSIGIMLLIAGLIMARATPNSSDT
ncbi:MAG: DMT family transporter [Kordiimonadaceae bacterium]|nr:DMT family transporter [Kordiimonadaceae bacterium]